MEGVCLSGNVRTIAKCCLMRVENWMGVKVVGW